MSCRTPRLDPIFWLHHANIDRLWEVWLRRDAAHLNATARRAGRRPAEIPDAGVDGPLHLTAREMLDMSVPQLDYVYEDVSDPLGGRTRLADRFAMLGGRRRARHGHGDGAAMARPPQAELLGLRQAVRLEVHERQYPVALDPQATRKLSASFALTRHGDGRCAAEPIASS